MPPRPIRRFALLTALTAAAVGFVRPARAMPVPPTNAPLERLLRNTSAYVAKHPSDPQGYFTRGRLHYFAYALRRPEIPILRGSEEDSLPRVYDIFRAGRPSSFGEPQQKPRTMSQAEQKRHVRAAIADLTKAIALRDAQEKKDPAPPAGGQGSISAGTRGLYDLTLACVYEDGRALAGADWQEKAIVHYRKAFERGAPEDLARERQPIFGLSTLVTHEAGASYARLVRRRGVRANEKAFLARVDAALAKLKNLKPGPVTPIVFSLRQPTSALADLLHAPARPVSFDLSGSRTPQRYALWPRPETALLVWDPTQSGRVTSGRQLFGTATWWLIFSDGYRALDALDDDRDGWLKGKELDGLALWYDRNGSGVSETGEVVPLARTEIAGIRTAGTSVGPDGVLASPRGLLLRDGTRLPTYDWIATPL